MFYCVNCYCIGALNSHLRCAFCDSDQVVECHLTAPADDMTRQILEETDREERFYTGLLVGAIGGTFLWGLILWVFFR
jgi:hypothetical protein